MVHGRETPCALIVCVVVLQYMAQAQLVAPAQAQATLDFALEIDAPAQASCTPAEPLQRAIEERVGRLVFLDAAEPSRRIRVSITPELVQRTWSARIAMRTERDEVVGERRITTKGTQCSELDEALIVVISTLIGIADSTPPRRSVKASAEHAARDLHSAAHAPNTQHAAAAAVPATRSAFDEHPANLTPSQLEVLAVVGGRAEIGLLPGLAPGAVVDMGLDFGTWALVIGATFLPRVSQDLDGGAQARFISVFGDVRLCWDAARPFGAALSFCASAEAGVIAVSTTGLDTAANRLEPVLRGLIGPRLRVPVRAGFGFFAGFDGVVPGVLSRFYFLEASGEPHYYHSVKLGVSAQIGVSWLFSS